jgi:hypothetical protein
MLGWEIRISYRAFDPVLSAGFSAYMVPPKKSQVRVKHMIMMAGVSYAVEVVALIWWWLRSYLLDYFHYIWPEPSFFFGVAWGKVFYWYMFITLFLGGMPLPEELLAPLQYITIMYPHMVITVLLHLLAAAIFAQTMGPYLATLLVSFTFTALLYKELGYQKQLTQTRSDIAAQTSIPVIDEFMLF